MYGLVHRAIQCFAQDTYGGQLWDEVARSARLSSPEFEAMLTYPDKQLDDVLDALALTLKKSHEQVCEDIGAYLVTHNRMNSIRRLMRFGGAGYFDFVLSLDELHERVKLALPELHLPRLEVTPISDMSFVVLVNAGRPNFGSVVLGLLRAMADDYGALAVFDLGTKERGGITHEVVHVELFDTDFSSGREFELVNQAAGL